MDGISPLDNVGAVTAHANVRVAAQARQLTEQLSVAQEIGTAALKLIRAAIVLDSATGNDLDVRV